MLLRILLETTRKKQKLRELFPTFSAFVHSLRRFVFAFFSLVAFEWLEIATCAVLSRVSLTMLSIARSTFNWIADCERNFVAFWMNLDNCCTFSWKFQFLRKYSSRFFCCCENQHEETRKKKTNLECRWAMSRLNLHRKYYQPLARFSHFFDFDYHAVV